MRAIITRPREDGSYSEVGMNNTIITSIYKTEKNLLKYAIPDHFNGRLKIEFIGDNDLLTYKTIYYYKDVIPTKVEKDYNQLLVDFMFEKSRMIHYRNEIPVSKYFNNNDAIVILEWSKSIAKRVYNKVSKTIKNIATMKLRIEEVSDADICPFCVKLQDVENVLINRNKCLSFCPYSKSHGYCNDDLSDYSNLFDNNYCIAKNLIHEEYRILYKVLEGE